MLAVALTACSADAAPAPSPTGFASEEEAFAAAEETYRAYVDALNEVDLSDPATFEGVYAWTTGEANAGARKSFSQMHADGWTVSGTTTFDNVELRATALNEPQGLVSIAVCIDVTDVGLLDESGDSMTSADRVDKQPLFVTFSRAATSTGLSIDSSSTTEHECGS